MLKPIFQVYHERIESFLSERDKHYSKERFLPGIRLVVFLVFLVMFYKYLIAGQTIYLFYPVIALVLFLSLSLWDNRLKRKIDRCNRLILICENEIKSISGDYTPFDSGNEYIDSDHNYAFDLDLFGVNSLFHSINRCATIFGKNRLSVYLKEAFYFKDHLSKRQETIKEWSEKHDFRQQVQLVFFDEKSTEQDRKDLINWLESDNSLLSDRLVQLLRYVLPVITNLFILLCLMGFVVVQIPVLLFIIQLFIISLYGRKTIRAQVLLTSKFRTIRKYALFLRLIEKSEFKSDLANEIKQKFSYDGVVLPSKIINQLSGLLNWMDSNLNILAAVILNGLFLFNLQLLVAVEKWKSKYKTVIPDWFELTGEVEALASLANFSANNPDFNFPVAVENEFLLEATDLGHPLILKNECITNNISISGWNQYCIITGANMSGKSTFLRTVGINYVLAMLGAPVFASRFIFCPVILHSSIRTSDSLSRKESFFYAELKRLKSIITALEKGQRTFILLDEILKGTNSKDKQAGSIALLEQLIKYQSVGLIATHDLILGDLINEYPENIHNLCFEIQIVNDQMSIDYKLQDGICQNLNATFLMKKMGILIN